MLEVVVQIGLAAAHAGDVGQGLDLHLVLHKGGHLGGGDASGTAAAGTTGDADKGRIHLLGFPQQVLKLSQPGSVLGGKTSRERTHFFWAKN